jgi:D-alanine-D-alanine ligase
VKRLRIIVLVDERLIPPVETQKTRDDFAEWVTEFDVCSTLIKMGHEVKILGVYSDLKIIRTTIEEFKPHLIYNLLEEFNGETFFDQNVVSYLELLGVPYTGCNPRGLIMARDKALTKKILTYHRIKTPKFWAFRKGQRRKIPKSISYPAIVKCLKEDASYGISKASVVHNENALKERIEYVHKKLSSDVIVEEFIEGRELYVGILGNNRLQTFPVWELHFEKSDSPEKELYSTRAKFNKEYRNRKGIRTSKAKISDELEKKIYAICKRAYKVLDQNGYSRIDIRLTDDNEVYVIEANPNPDISSIDEFASSAKEAGLKYDKLLEKILIKGLSWSSV